MDYDEMKKALSGAARVMSLADSFASDMARLLVGRLRGVNSSLLIKLKRELKDYNMHTREWR